MEGLGEEGSSLPNMMMKETGIVNMISIEAEMSTDL